MIKPKPANARLPIAAFLLLFISSLLFFAVHWYVNTYGQLGFDAVLYTLLSDMSGVQAGLVISFLKSGLLPTVLVSIILTAFLFYRGSDALFVTLFGKLRLKLFPLSRVVRRFLFLLIPAFMITNAVVNVQLPEYIYYLNNLSTVYEDEYADPDEVTITFPQEKRNLIYIFLESMETTYFSTREGGALPHNLIPNLYALADNNTNFSHNDSVGGFFSAPGTEWTIGAMVGQTAGVSLKTPPGLGGNDYGKEDNFLPGLTTLTDILHRNGYYQCLMVGSDASFGGRRTYFSQHGIDRIYDYHTAIKDGIIPQDYYVWWGMEDAYLFEYAKRELTALASRPQPFNFTMLTVDTHHVDGYLCQYCGSEYAEQYDNVIRCSDRQVSEFVSWITQQDFYPNTTVVIVGDHRSMDGAYFERNAPDFDRRIYNCILNAPIQAVQEKNRQFVTMDLFPTTLAALGCTIENDRLGLGTNLFSGKPTLAEQYGLDRLNQLLQGSSSYYFDHFY